MKKSLISLIALAFTVMLGVAQAAKHEAPANDALMTACKDKKPGTQVTVDGKKVKCPKPKNEEKKEEKKEMKK